MMLTRYYRSYFTTIVACSGIRVDLSYFLVKHLFVFTHSKNIFSVSTNVMGIKTVSMNVKQRKTCASLIAHAIRNVHKDVLAMAGVKIPLLQSNIRSEK